MKQKLRSFSVVLAGVSLFLSAPGCGARDADPETAADPAGTPAAETASESPASFFELQVSTLEGEPAQLADYQGQVVLAVNTASKCGLTPQYEGIEALHRELQPAGLAVLGFPSNDFQGQEPGTPEEIREFCTTKFDVTFPLFEKMVVTGENKAEVYRFLTAGHAEPNWNFTKYLIDRRGQVRHRFAPQTAPDDAELRAKIQELLAEEI